MVIEMTSGLPPWSQENFENPFRALYHIGNSGKSPQLPDGLSCTARDFTQRCLDRDVDSRPAAAELMEEEWIRGAVQERDDDHDGRDGRVDDESEGHRPPIDLSVRQFVRTRSTRRL